MTAVEFSREGAKSAKDHGGTSRSSRLRVPHGLRRRLAGILSGSIEPSGTSLSSRTGEPHPRLAAR
jgi:hypothetical protein